MKATKQIVAFLLTFAILLTMIPASAITAFATTQNNSVNQTEFIDIDIYKAQCLAGIAYDPNSNAVDLCNSMYNYYINDNIHSPTQTFLEECYSDDALMADYTEWMAYSLAASPSSALDYVMKKEDYYETLIIAMYMQALTEDSEWKKIINNKIVNDTTNILSGLCDVLKLEQASQLDEILDLSDPKTFEYVSDTVEKYYPVGTAGKVVGVIGTALKYGKNITDACQRISTYNAMVELDNSAKLWLNQMYESCDRNTDPSLKAALLDLKSASTGFAEAALVDIKEVSFSLANWGIQAVMDYGVAQLAALNPITASVVVGLQAGKTICNVFFATDDVCEQLFLMECIYDVQHLSRTVADDCKATFINNQTKDNALSFTFSVECYYESIIDVDVDCMIKFLDKLYNGGILKGFLKWIYGATDDYDQCVAALEALRTARMDNYNAMNDYYRQALQINYPDTYKYYFVIEQIVPITGIGFQKYTILPPGYPVDYANIIVGNFSYVDVYFEPSNTTQKAYTLTSDNPDVLEINDGVMTAISEGTANVTVTSIDNPAISYTSEIKVGAKLVDVDIDTSTTRFKYKIENNEITITGLISGYNSETLQIPEAISEYPVTKIADFAFLNNKSIKNITIPSTVTEIGNHAFYKCSALTQINFSEGLDTIGDGAFGNCSVLKAVILPYTVSNLGVSAFENCSSLLNVQLSNRITELKDRTFYNCDSLEEITVSKYVTKFGQGIFGGCDSLKKVFFGINKSPATNKQIYHTSSTLQNIKNITISDDVQIIDTMCFYGTELYSVTIPDSIKTIGGYVGDYSDLNHIFYEGNESSWSSLMSKASQYGSTQTLSKIKNAGHIHFKVSLQNNTSIKDEVAPTCTTDGTNNIYCNICNELLGSEVIPATGHVGKLVQKVLPTCTEQGYSKYYCIVCDEEYITDYVSTHQHNYDENGSCYTCDKNIFFKYSISNGEVTITDCLTNKSKLTIPNHIEFLPVKHIANNAFEGRTVIENIKLSNSITSIGEKAFSDCTSIANIDIPDSVISIGEYAFSNCSNIKTITIGSAVTSIGNYSFADCINVVQINYNATDASENINADSYNLFENAGTSGEGIKVIIGNNVKTIPENLFWSHNQYSYVPPKIINATIGRNVEIIGDAAFARCSDLANITFSGNKLTTIEDEAFSGCNFTSLSLPRSIKSIGWLSFARCPIESIVIPGEMRNIGDSAFYWCEELSNVVIEDGATVVGGFEGCTSIKQIRIPDSVATINSGAFYGCSSLEEIDFGNGVTTISQNAFDGCSSIQNLNLPNELVYIGKSAFGNCDGLTKVIIPNKVESIEEYAFEGCSSLKEIKLGNSVKNIGKSAFYTCWSLNAAYIPKSMANIGDGAFDSHSFWHVFYEGNAEDWSAITIGNSNDEFINATRHYNVTEYDITYSVEDEPTCLGGGSASYNCSICNDKQYSILSQLEHQGELSCSVPQSCSSEGYDLYICSYCGQEYRLNVVEPLEHEVSLINTINGGCTIGSINVHQCLNCNDYCYIPDSVATKEHVFQNGSCVDCHVQEGWEYSIAPSKDGIIVTKYTGSNEEVVIPDSFFGIPVISIGARAFQDCSVIKSIIVPNSVVSLEGYVFMNCSQLETVTLGNNVTSIGYSVFENCSSLENIYIPSSMTEITNYAFYGCQNLKDVYYSGTKLQWNNLTINSGNDILLNSNVHCNDGTICKEHYWNDGVVSIIPTCKEKGQLLFTCIICGETKAEEMPMRHNVIDGICGTCGMLEVDCIESSHNYKDNCDETWTINKAGAKQIAITFSKDTYTESGCDFIYIYDGNDNLIGEYSGSELASKQLVVNGDTIKIRLTSDSSVTKYGFAIIGIKAFCDNNSHTYDNACDTSCNVCGKTRTITHDYTDASCKAPKTCKVCGSTSGSKLSHKSDGGTVTKKATCTATGTKTYKCTLCKANIKADTIAKVAHKYDSGKVTKKATCKATGVKTYTCSVCKGTKTSAIAKLTIHTYSNNCDKSCNVCGKTRAVGAHKYSNNCDTSCNVCKATRTITHSYKTTTTKATLTKNGSIVKKCTVCGKVASKSTIKYVKSFKLSTTTYTYDGKVKTPSVTVKDSAGKTLKKNTDYTVTYVSGRKNVGIYKVTIKMKGKYSGTKALTFKINPAKTMVSKLTAGKKSITVAITKKSTQVTGYQIQYSTSKSFSKATTKTISSYKTTKYTLKSLSAKKTYYVRVRTYKTVGKTKYYSGWSTYKYVKTK